jgi:hypothetical protein
MSSFWPNAAPLIFLTIPKYDGPVPCFSGEIAPVWQSRESGRAEPEAQSTRLRSSPLGAKGTRLRPFSQGRISKKVPPGRAVTPYFEVCARVPLGVSRHFVKPQNMGSPPSNTVDAALRKGAWRRDGFWKLLNLACPSLPLTRVFFKLFP